MNSSENNVNRVGFFEAYGGWKEVRKSRYARWSLVATVAAFPLALRPDWWDVVLTVSPSLAGFALGALALLMSVGDEKFRYLLAGSKDDTPSPLLKTAGTFTYFIVVQCLALGCAILAKAYYFELPDWLVAASPWVGIIQLWATRLVWFVFVWIFAYSVALTAAASIALYTYVRWFDTMVRRKKDADAKKLAANMANTGGGEQNKVS
jgi:hypothetical protein